MFCTQQSTNKQTKMKIQTSVPTPDRNPIRTWVKSMFIKALTPPRFQETRKNPKRDNL